MRSIRLLPIVVLAASALLVLKTAGLVTGSGYTLGGILPASAQEEAVPDPETGDAEELAEGQDAYSAEELAAAEAAAAAMFESTPDGARGGNDVPIMEQDGSGSEPVSSTTQDTEAQILQRLTERRAELDAFEAELEERLAVVEAAEMRAEERMAELSEVEAQINAMVDAQEAEEDAQFSAVVAMYESMRAKDAARIFDDLDMTVLERVGQSMNPRKLGPILAEMDAARAQDLTVLLAAPDAAAANAASANGAGGAEFGNLPQIVGE